MTDNLEKLKKNKAVLRTKLTNDIEMLIRNENVDSRIF